MSAPIPLPTSAALPDWRIGPVALWLRPHPPRTSGEATARCLLAAELGVTSAQLPLYRDARGRPGLHAPLAHVDTGWSHSGDYLLVAVAANARLGVDIERQLPRPRLLELAQRFFHPDEAAALLALATPAREALFFRLWCAKEALLKAHGHGLAFGLHRLCFAEDATGGLHLAWCDPALGSAACWQVHEWQAASGYRAALAWRRLDSSSR
ncbi:4'-phosphopantetheinyl transferase family protein [Xanthomonas albilineans]|uniref:Putative 4'-phosphopantetheinyl transferase protein n=1 Tax=Xanthomonas albilineans (strain GPE PC73 / CFBP 7063) TaxID=380358 RepID=D2U8G6_XANAP|nr:4'-phosphopantetheinyl transferase superfamily protein [Xanthomonas albilineans]QHQ26907.1 putative 4-phosphopantetheinyl transferase protein [Xanthomonas albilineans]CBA14647.1 putative 4'-phosphopantetheinyl transferase protein [Xanthomonas albilineans GPE PC73]